MSKKITVSTSVCVNEIVDVDVEVSVQDIIASLNGDDKDAIIEACMPEITLPQLVRFIESRIWNEDEWKDIQLAMNAALISGRRGA